MQNDRLKNVPSLNFPPLYFLLGYENAQRKAASIRKHHAVLAGIGSFAGPLVGQNETREKKNGNTCFGMYPRAVHFMFRFGKE